MSRTYPMRIIEYMQEHYKRYNGTDPKIGWYMCIPMKVIAKELGMTIDELGEQTWYFTPEKSEEGDNYEHDDDDGGHWKPSPFN